MPWHWITKVAAVPAAPPQTRSLLISAGHDDRDPGAVANGKTEADIVLDFRDLLSHRLAAKGVVHLKDGEFGENLPLREASRLARTCDTALEFHCNAGPPSATGPETLSRNRDFPLAGRLCSVIADTLGLPNRGARPENAGQHSRLAFVSDGGGIIVELFFLTNAGDLSAYEANRTLLADDVASLLSHWVRQP